MPKRFVVEWCSHIPLDDCGDRDIDRAVYKTLDYNTFERALTVALEKLSDDKFGCVRIIEERIMKMYGQWEEYADLYINHDDDTNLTINDLKRFDVDDQD